MSMKVGKKGYNSDINITPYIDILLVLLIIFMTTAPMQRFEHQIRVPQPAPKLQPKDVKPDSIIVEISLDRTVKLNSQPITLENLESTLTTVFSRRVNRNLFVRGDSSLPYGAIFDVLDIARRSGAGDIALLEMNSGNTSTGGSKGSR